MKKVGILDGQTVQALTVAKQLNLAGYRVILFCDAKLSYGFYTRYAHKRVICPSTKYEVKKFHDFFLNYLQSEGLDVVVPMSDYSAKYLSENKKELREKVRFLIPDFEIFMNGYDKNRLMKICEANNFPHPKTVNISSLVAGSSIPFNFPALIKPNETTGARGFKKVDSFKEVWEHYDAIYKEYGACHLQEFIPPGGIQYGVQLLMKDKVVLNSSVIAKYRYYPIQGGSGCFIQTIDKQEIVELCTEVLRLIHWEGFADFDLIEDPRDGSMKIIEINPRIPACVKASVNAGVDFPKAIVELSLNQTLTTYAYRPGNYLRHFSLDLLWLFSSQNKLSSIKTWMKYFLSKRHFFMDGEIWDPIPFIVGAFSGIAKQLDPTFRSKKEGMNTALLFALELEIIIMLL